MIYSSITKPLTLSYSVGIDSNANFFINLAESRNVFNNFLLYAYD